MRRPGKGSPVKVPVSGRQVRLGDLAEYLGLAPSTVSRVINRSPDARSIPLRTQERILRGAEELNYHPNMMAKSLRKQRSYTINLKLNVRRIRQQHSGLSPKQPSRNVHAQPQPIKGSAAYPNRTRSQALHTPCIRPQPPRALTLMRMVRFTFRRWGPMS